jgi:alpha-N-arabinofuranosidase
MRGFGTGIKIGLCFSAALLLSWGLSMVAAAAADKTTADNPVPNPSFEEAKDGLPVGWTQENWQARAEFGTDETARTGKTGARISSKEGADASWTAIVPITPFAKYRLSGWVKTKDLDPGTGRGALLNIQGMDVASKPLRGTQDWTPLQVEFDSGANDAVAVNCLFGGWGKATGTAWYDDIRLELLSVRPMKPRVAVDAAVALAPVSPLIYGQFIEHLGRCIYQGIWAEMLEDRKFFYPVGAADSPWKAVGDAANVRMNPILPYAGVQAPEVRLKGNGEAGGIAQDGLAVLKGKSYVGRIVLAGDPGAAPIEVSLVWGTAPEARRTVSLVDFKTDYRTFPISFTAGASTENAGLEIASRGIEAFRVGTISLMPADNVEGFRPDVLALLRELDSPIYRWPGGNFVSGYDWRDGTGDRDRRPPRKNPAWQGVEHNDVGVHEFMDLCRLIEAEPYITVNSGQGNETLAADMVEYVNGAASTPMGALRALNGRAEPWRVAWWSIGNEMYGGWQLGHMPVQDYVLKHNRFAAAMRAKDPAIKLVAVGAVGDWSQRMLAACRDAMDAMSEHFYVADRPGLLSHVYQVPAEVKRIADAHRRYRRTIGALAGKPPAPVALDEWNYWYGPDLYGEIGVRYFLKDALGIAAGLHEFVRQSDMFVMANYAQTVNVIGAIKTTKTAAAFDATGLVLKLYRAAFGTIPVRVTGAPAPLDVAAAWREGRKVLTVAVVNPTKDVLELPIALEGIKAPAKARLHLITGPGPDAYNEPGKDPVLQIETKEGAPFGERLSLPPLSISLYELEAK